MEHTGISLAAAHGNYITTAIRYHDAQEYQLLHQLLARPGAVATRERLSAALYGWQDSGPGNTLEVLIHNLRKSSTAG